jgi:hypothetical protein
MDGVTLLLPEPELNFYQAYAQNANAFVVELGGAGGVPPVARGEGGHVHTLH